MSRPFDRWSSVIAAIAVAVGVRAAICTTPVPILIVVVWAATHARERERVVAPRLRHPHRVEAEALGFLRQLDEVRARLRPPVPEHDTELHSFPYCCASRPGHLRSSEGDHTFPRHDPSDDDAGRHRAGHGREPWDRTRDRGGARGGRLRRRDHRAHGAHAARGPMVSPAASRKRPREIEAAGRAATSVPLDLMDRDALRAHHGTSRRRARRSRRAREQRDLRGAGPARSLRRRRPRRARASRVRQPHRAALDLATVARAMAARGRGTIVNISSGAGMSDPPRADRGGWLGDRLRNVEGRVPPHGRDPRRRARPVWRALLQRGTRFRGHRACDERPAPRMGRREGQAAVGRRRCRDVAARATRRHGRERQHDQRGRGRPHPRDVDGR